MKKDQFKKNLHAHVLLVPAACRLDLHGLELKAPDDDWWLVSDITDEGITIADPRSGHTRLLGFDHVYKFTSDASHDGSKRGFLSLHVQLFVQGNKVSVVPNTRPGDPVAPKRVEIVDKLVEYSHPTDSGIQQRLESRGYRLSWVRPERVNGLVDVQGWEIVIERNAGGALSKFHTKDGSILVKGPKMP